MLSKKTIAKEVIILYSAFILLLLIFSGMWIKSKIYQNKANKLIPQISHLDSKIDSLNNLLTVITIDSLFPIKTPNWKTVYPQWKLKYVSEVTYNFTQQFGKLIKKKYPEYKEIDNDELSQRVFANNPQYKFIMLKYTELDTPFNHYEFCPFSNGANTWDLLTGLINGIGYAANVTDPYLLSQIVAESQKIKNVNIQFILDEIGNFKVIHQQYDKAINLQDKLKSKLLEYNSQVYSSRNLWYNTKIIALIILLIIYPVRFIILSLIWAIKNLRNT